MKNLVLPLATRLLRRFGLHVYPYKKADCTATVVLLFDEGKHTLVITRKKNPFKGKNAFPGGFLNVGDETLEQNAQRELQEETSVELPLSWFIPVDARSAPDRDPRGHVIDHGFVVVVPASESASIKSRIKASDDASAADVVPVEQLLKTGMAFDHVVLLKSSLAKAGFSTTQ